MKKIVKSPKKQSAKITKLKMRVGEIANMLLQNNPKMVRMRSGGSSGYADLFMSKQLMKGGMTDGTRNEIVDFLKDQKNESAVKELKGEVIEYLEQNEEDIKGIGDKEALISELNNDNVYDYKLCDKYDDTDVELQDNLITLDIVNKFYNLVKDKKGADGKSLLPDYPSVKATGAATKLQSNLRMKMVEKARLSTKENAAPEGVTKIEAGAEPVVNGVDGVDKVAEIEAGPVANEVDGVNEEAARLAAAEDGAGREAGARLAAAEKEGGAQGGKPPAKYKSTGRIVHIMYKKRNYKRTVYVKDKRNTKYCKIDGEYILLSKMKMIA